MFKDLIKTIIRKSGFEVRRFSPITSEAARMQCLFNYYNIDLVLDVGANRGDYAKFIRELGYAGRIVSFEPLSSAYSQLQASSCKDPLWEVAPRTAIGSKNEEVTINIAANSQSSSILEMLETHVEACPASAYCGSERVSLSRLDTIAKNYINSDTSSIFLKMDVQGFEKEAIAGASQILHLIKGIQVELSLVPLYKGEFFYKEMIELIENLGYELYGVIPGFTDVKTGRLMQMDGIFFKQ
jgi:FkbM family methyltransferase